MRIALCQFDIAWLDRPKNYATVRHLVESRKPAEGSLLVLPEMFSTGFSLDTLETREWPGGDTENFLSDLAQDFGLYVLAGLVRAASAGAARNEATLVGPRGRELGRYGKLHLFSAAGEDRAHSPGDGVETFPVENTIVAPFVCYDLRFPEIFRMAVQKRAEVLVVIANWPTVRVDHWVTLLRARAIENLAYVIGVNRIGRDPEREYPGRSLVVDPRGEVVMDAGDRAGVFEVELDLAGLRAWREEFPALRDARYF
ncbi:MAG: carbon-nitrogen family hydrolase [Verrucomicrobia bacterium]|nr:carbon-nitrogen family hydrolase [Verrucomicrobiota bacterium]